MKVSKATRQYVLERDAYKCLSCGESDTTMLTMDHIKPVCKGGQSNPNNLQTLCRICNSKKSDRYMDVRGNDAPRITKKPKEKGGLTVYTITPDNPFKVLLKDVKIVGNIELSSIGTTRNNRKRTRF